MSDSIEKAFIAHQDVFDQVRQSFPSQIKQIADLIVAAIGRGKTVFWCGNGGSAADSQHLAAELVGRFRRERHAIASIALTTDTSILTAIGNDYGFDNIFSRQVEALVREGDVLIGISTSGNSGNICTAFKKGREQGACIIGLLGNDGGHARSLCDFALVVPSVDTARIQEMHTFLGHIICDLVESALV